MLRNEDTITRKLSIGYAAAGLGSAVNDVSNAPDLKRAGRLAGFHSEANSFEYISQATLRFG